VVAADVKIDVDPDEEFFDAADGQTVATIKELLETRVRPAVAGDGAGWSYCSRTDNARKDPLYEE
jgi:hypothetical protein